MEINDLGINFVEATIQLVYGKRVSDYYDNANEALGVHLSFLKGEEEN